MTGAHRRNAPLALRAIAQTVSSVATALIGAPKIGRALRDLRQHAEDDRHHGDGDKHDDRPGDRRRQHASEQGEPCRECELKQRGDDHQGRQQRRPAFDQCRHANGDESPRRSHGQHVAGADASEADRLHHRGRAANGNGGEHRPGKVRFASPGGADDDRRRQDDPGYDENHQLHAETHGEGEWRPLVGFVAD